jgi:NTE family protein
MDPLLSARVFALSLCFLLPALAQPAPTNAKGRQKIGLALEGGGALGLAHIGLLKWMAQNHVPVDYIAGASMGGLVAGFYASGMTPDEMHQLLDALNWPQLVATNPYDRKFSFRRKEDVHELGNQTMLGVRHGLGLPIGLNSGQQLYFLLSRISAPYDQMRSFDDLPTPFRCLATDLSSAKSHMFEKGSLAEALRATMSIPGLFDPVWDGNHEYVDGGLLNNLPVDVVKSMGADVVIAVYLAADRFDVNKAQSFTDVLRGSLSAMIIAQERHNMEQADLLIALNLSGLSQSAFSQYDEMIQRGFEGAQKKAVILSKFALDDTEWNVYLDSRISKRKTAVPKPEFIDVTGIDGDTAKAIRSFFAQDIGRPFNPVQVQAQIEKAMGNDAFAFMAYDIIQRDGMTGLVIHVQPAPSKPPTLQPAVRIDGSDYRNPRPSLAGRLTFVNAGGFRSEWRTDFSVGSTYSFSSEYFRPLTPSSNWFIAPRVFAYTRPMDFYRHFDILANDRQQAAGGGLDVGYQIGTSNEIRMGYETSMISTKVLLGDPNLFPKRIGRYGSTHFSYALNDVDDDVVPHRGVLAAASLRWVDANPGARQSFPVLEGRASYFQPLSKTSTVFATVAGGTFFDRQNSGIPQFYLGGSQMLKAYGTNELFGNEYVYGRAGYLKEIAMISAFINYKIYLLADFELGKMYGFSASTRLPMDMNGGLVIKTPLAPLFLGGSMGDAGHRKLYFQVGRLF